MYHVVLYAPSCGGFFMVVLRARPSQGVGFFIGGNHYGSHQLRKTRAAD